MIILTILASVSLALVIEWNVTLPKALNVKPFNCSPCLSTWIALTFSVLIFSGIEIILIPLVTYLITTLTLWLLEH